MPANHAVEVTDVPEGGTGAGRGIGPDLVDLHGFRAFAAAPRDCRDDDMRATELLDEAAGLWRGMPLAGIDGDWAARTRDGIEQEPLTVLADAFELLNLSQ